MSTFDEREHAAESKFAYDAETMFRAHVRRDRKLGLWAAKLLGKGDAEANVYAEALVEAEIGAGDEKAVAGRVSADLTQGGRGDSAAQVNAKMQEFLAAALAELKAGQG